MTFEYFINLFERGEFFADVRLDGDTVWETHGFEIFDDGFMDNVEDLNSLQVYLTDLGIMGDNDRLIAAN